MTIICPVLQVTSPAGLNLADISTKTQRLCPSSCPTIRMSGSGTPSRNQVEEQLRLQVSQGELIRTSCYYIPGGECRPDPQPDRHAGEGFVCPQAKKILGRDNVTTGAAYQPQNQPCFRDKTDVRGGTQGP